MRHATPADGVLGRGISHTVLMGTMVSVYAAFFTFAANVGGGTILGLQPLELLRVYATFFMGGAPSTARLTSVSC